MHTRLFGTSILALTLAAVLSAACTKSSENPGTTGTTGVDVRVSHIDMGRSLNADKTISDNSNSFKANDTIYASVATVGTAPTAALKARWTYQDGQVVNESTQTIAPTGDSPWEQCPYRKARMIPTSDPFRLKPYVCRRILRRRAAAPRGR